MARYNSLRLCVLCALATLASACALVRGAPEPIPAAEVLPNPATASSVSAGGDHLRGFLSAD